ncbi:hypothetical protein SAMN04515647_1608 [Cohaesibacter sp. ES.047]|nr:hypothetical protein SAMN04515647_1608 [Cohaesibacter sp. ES.047]
MIREPVVQWLVALEWQGGLPTACDRVSFKMSFAQISPLSADAPKMVSSARLDLE